MGKDRKQEIVGNFRRELDRLLIPGGYYTGQKGQTMWLTTCCHRPDMYNKGKL